MTIPVNVLDESISVGHVVQFEFRIFPFVDLSQNLQIMKSNGRQVVQIRGKIATSDSRIYLFPSLRVAFHNEPTILIFPNGLRGHGSGRREREAEGSGGGKRYHQVLPIADCLITQQTTHGQQSLDRRWMSLRILRTASPFFRSFVSSHTSGALAARAGCGDHAESGSRDQGGEEGGEEGTRRGEQKTFLC